GVAGSKTAEFCARHAREGMINVKSKSGGNDYCISLASYGVEGGRRAREKIGGVTTTYHVIDGCSTEPSCGVTGSRKAKSCDTHAREGLVDVEGIIC
ncbi:unnamed protein product, partial [Sphacelaria rigidula]